MIHGNAHKRDLGKLWHKDLGNLQVDDRTRWKDGASGCVSLAVTVGLGRQVQGTFVWGVGAKGRSRFRGAGQLGILKEAFKREKV